MEVVLLGAGTILDGLKNNMHVISFVNERLKDNHQKEIVEALIEKKNISGFLSLADYNVAKVN